MDRNKIVEFHSLLPKFELPIGLQEIFGCAYAGTGFILVNNKLRKDRKVKYDIYDINSAYQSALIGGIFPLSKEGNQEDLQVYSFKKPIDAEEILNSERTFTKFLALMEIEGVGIKYPEYDIRDIRTSNLEYNIKNDSWVGWLCDVDIDNLKKLYTYKRMTFKKMIVFKYEGFLSNDLKKYILYNYEELHKIPKSDPERKERKMNFHILTYGKNAQVNRPLLDKVGTLVRTPYVTTAIYQAAYTRKRMIDLFIQFKEDILYMDTDSIFVRTADTLRVEVNDKIGSFKLEYRNVYVDLWNIKGYAVYDNKRRLLDVKQSGLKTKLSKEEIDAIMDGKTIIVTEDRKGKQVDIRVYSRLILGDQIFA